MNIASFVSRKQDQPLTSFRENLTWIPSYIPCLIKGHGGDSYGCDGIKNLNSS
uniref:Uncharacterized protein n=1 Tax=Solanum tuberosum TaxID=4113 RepID=M1CY79_SOLTU